MNKFKKILKENKTPLSIIIAAIIISISLFAFDNSNNKNTENLLDEIINQDKYFPGRDFSNDEYLIGDKDSKINLVVYKDYECPFCIKFQNETINPLIEKYKNNKNVGIVYRHFAQSYHIKAPIEINASFCIREMYGQNAYKNFIQNIYAINTGNDGLDLSKLPELAKKSVSENERNNFKEKEFNECVNTMKYKDKMIADHQDAIVVGLEGTPYSIITYQVNGKNLIIQKISGARNIKFFETIIDKLLEVK